MPNIITSPIQDDSFKSEFLIDSRINQFRDSLLTWFKSNGRHWIPWKLKEDGTLPSNQEELPVYPILVAEVMLQQTQLKVVLPYWNKWMKALPLLSDLANTDENNVLLLWQGLGYYSRAKRLHSCAKTLVKQTNSIDSRTPINWQKDIRFWKSLPGIGDSTAGSILSSAFNCPEPLLDGNVKRILARLIASKTIPSKDLSRYWELSRSLLDPNSPRIFNQALMDLGANVCTPRNPKCYECPLKQFCFAYLLGDPNEFPLKMKKNPLPHLVIGIGLIFNNAQELLISKRLTGKSMGGMWEFPGGKKEANEDIEVTIAREIYEELDIQVKVGEKLIEFDHSYTHRKFHFVVHLCEYISGTPKPLASQEFLWVKLDQLEDFPFPAANARIISSLKSHLES